MTPDQEKLVLDNQMLVVNCAKFLKMSVPSLIYDDLIGEGNLALVWCAINFNSSYEVKFRTYARRRIVGSLRDYQRSIDFVGRNTRNCTTELEKLSPEVADASDSELALLLSASRKTVSYARQLAYNGRNGGSIQRIDDYDFLRCRETSPEKLAINSSASSLVQQFLSGLTLKQQTAIKLYYLEDRTMLEIAEILKVNESRVSQLISRAKRRSLTFLCQAGLTSSQQIMA